MGRRKSPQQEKAFSADTATVSGESKSQINRHIARAEAIGDDLERVGDLCGAAVQGGGVIRHARAREVKLRQIVAVWVVSRHARAREVPPAWG